MIPPALLSSKTPLTLTLVIGSFGDEAPLKFKVGSISPANLTPEAPVRYGPRPEIIHQFRPAVEMANRYVTLLFCGATVLLFFGLIGVVCVIWKSKSCQNILIKL